MNRTTTILYADDDADDKAWIREACKAIDCTIQFDFVENGREALQFLESNLKQLPSLIVLDLNMPELDGRQTLKQIKSDDRLMEIPVAIVTTSSNKIDREICERLGAALFLTKPDTHKEWQTIVRQLEPLILD